jgi:hypothetical protein
MKKEEKMNEVKENNLKFPHGKWPDGDFDSPENEDQQGVDKAPGEERGKGEKVTPNNLKGKKVDADPEEEQ